MSSFVRSFVSVSVRILFVFIRSLCFDLYESLFLFDRDQSSSPVTVWVVFLQPWQSEDEIVAWHVQHVQLELFGER